MVITTIALPVVSVVLLLLTAVAWPRRADAAVLPLTSCQIAIDVSRTVELRWSAEDIRTFRAEAQRVWAAAGVEFCWRDAMNRCATAPTTLYVRIAEDVPALEAGERRALGWIGFSDTTGPGPFIVLSVRRTAELLGRAERAARRLSELPGMIERMLPRALGRALAHELGHFLLARRAHSRAGVMRAGFRPEDLADDGAGQRMGLASVDLRALDVRCRTRAVGLTAQAVP
jgi:hypothetical protein